MVKSNKDRSAYVDDRSSTAKAMSKVSEIITACLMMIVPAIVGVWLDGLFSTVAIFTIIGLLFGVTGAFLQLKRLVSNPEKIDYDPSKIVKYEDDEDQEEDLTNDDDWE